MTNHIKFHKLFAGEWPRPKCTNCGQIINKATCYEFTIQQDGAYWICGLMTELCKEFKKGDKLTICQGVVVNEH